MIVGVTGSRTGPTIDQGRRLASYLRHPGTRQLHHGDCVGVDAFAHDVLFEQGKDIWVHPPTDASYRAWCGTFTVSLPQHVTVLPAKQYLERNRDIVDSCDRLVACPSGPEQLRSGTWATVRYARKVGKPITVIWPDGRITKEEGASVQHP